MREMRPQPDAVRRKERNLLGIWAWPILWLAWPTFITPLLIIGPGGSMGAAPVALNALRCIACGAGFALSALTATARMRERSSSRPRKNWTVMVLMGGSTDPTPLATGLTRKQAKNLAATLNRSGSRNILAGYAYEGRTTSHVNTKSVVISEIT